MARNIIEIKALTKRFGNFTAVDRINLSVREGEIFGFLGPNGAGKTTTISMLTTLIAPTTGTALVDGHDIHEHGFKVRAIIGVVPQTFSLFPELTAKENLEYIGKLYGLSDEEIEERSEELLKTVTLHEHSDRIAGVFSGGMKQRLSLAASLMSNPKILFMDEPTTGLDPQSRIAMRELTKKLNKSGMTVVYTTHDMDEAEKICDRITIMDKGRIIADGTSEELKHKIAAYHTVEVELETPSKTIIPELKKLSFVKSVSTAGELIIIDVKHKKGIFYKLSDFFHSRNQRVIELRFKEPTLEDVFIELTKKDLRD
ncbi:ABC transporter ATP-binding protein [Candidatus Woesearchaeota archaeon]|nr:ABC transporter ATP-binding protein [Candidatus Woesearchaeota archaeon]